MRPSPKLLVNLDRSIDNKALYDTFSLFGNILSCKVQCDREGKSQGYGFVHYETDEAAKQAIERVNGMQIGDKTVEVALFVKNTDRDQPEKAFTNLYIKNLPADSNEEKIKELFGGSRSYPHLRSDRLAHLPTSSKYVRQADPFDENAFLGVRALFYLHANCASLRLL